MYNEEVGKMDSIMVMGFVLISIDFDEDIFFIFLGLKMGMEVISFLCILKNMEEWGFIERKFNFVDGRSVLIYFIFFGKEMREFLKGVVFCFDEVVK